MPRRFFTSAGDPNFPQDSDNLDAEWGRSGFDVRHRFSVSFSYDLPFQFTVAGIVAMQSGRPFTAALLPEVDNSNTGTVVARIRRERSAEPERQRRR